jgi:hypothetical protein
MDSISANMYSYMFTKYLCVYICWEVGWDLEKLLFSLAYFSFWKSKAKDAIVKPWNGIDIESKLHRPSIKGTKLLIVIKAIVNSHRTQTVPPYHSELKLSCILSQNKICYLCHEQLTDARIDWQTSPVEAKEMVVNDWCRNHADKQLANQNRQDAISGANNHIVGRPKID